MDGPFFLGVYGRKDSRNAIGELFLGSLKRCFAPTKKYWQLQSFICHGMEFPRMDYPKNSHLSS